MGRIMQVIIAVAAMGFVIAFSSDVESAEPQAKPQSYEYTGTIKAMSEEAHVLTVQTQKGAFNFHYQRHGKRECDGFKELDVGDSVKVISSESKKVSEATCITKTRPAKR